MDEPLQAKDFEPHVGKLAAFDGTEHTLRLEQVETGRPLPAPFRQPFSLIFRGPKPGPVLPEGLYTCRIEGGPEHELHIAPIHTPAPDRQDYQVVFG